MQYGIRKSRRPNVYIDLEVIGSSDVVTCEGFAKQAGRIVPYGSPDDPRPSDNTVDELKPAIPEGIILIKDEAMQEGTMGDGFIKHEVKDGMMVVAAGDLEVNSKDKRFEGVAMSVSCVQGLHDTVILLSEDMIELTMRSKPVYT